MRLMENVLLALGAVLVVIGGYLVFSAAIDRRSKEAVRLGKLMRGGGIETVGVLLWTFGWSEGAKPTFALPVLMLAIGAGTLAGMLDGMIRNRRAPQGRHRR
jgi:hypothetical protein